MTLIGRNIDVNINLANVDCWAAWIDRQAKVGDQWVGEGKILIKADNMYFVLRVRNTLVVEVGMIEANEIIFSETARCFIEEVLKANHLSLFTIPNTELNELFFSYNNQDVFGIHNASQVRIGVPITIDNWIDISPFLQVNKHSFFEGKHIIRVSGVNYALQTIDSLIFNAGKSEVFKYIDWDVISENEKNTFLSVIFTGKYGNIENVDYEFDELRLNVLKTDAYRLIYNKVIVGKNNLHNVFWNDMLTNLTVTEDILPLIYESTGSGNISKLLPESKKDLVALSKYYNQNDDALFELNKQLKSATTDSTRSEIFVRMLTELKDTEGVSLLPELGDESKFENWSETGISDSKVQIHHWINCAEVISEALSVGIEQLNEKIKIKLLNEIRSDMSSNSIFYMLVGNQKTENQINCNNYTALTHQSMLLHDALESVFNNSSSFIEFARACRRTILTTVPRHPRYLWEWQWLLANVFKFFRKNILSEETLNEMPGHYKRKLLMDKNKNDYTESDKLCIVNPLIRLQYHMEEIDEPEYEVYDMLVNCQKEFNLNYKDKEKLKVGLEDLFDDFDLEFTDIRQNNQNVNLTKIYSDKPVILPNTALLIPWFFPHHNVKQKYIQNRKYYIYNYNDDKANDLKVQKVSKKDYSLYRSCLQYYSKNPDFNIVINTQAEVKFKDIEIDTVDLSKFYDINNPESYTDELHIRIIDEFKLNDNQRVSEDLLKVIKSNRTPSMKALMLKRIIANFLKEKEASIDQMLVSLLNEYKLSMDIDLKHNFLNQINYVKGNISSLIHSSTTLKKEYKQLESMLKNKFADIIGQKTILSSGNKKHLLSNINLLIQQLKIKKRKNNIAFLRILYHTVECCSEGHTNELGYEFDEMIREYITECTEPISDEEDLSEVDEPEYGVENWRLKIR